jgi:hypothetical protein
MVSVTGVTGHWPRNLKQSVALNVPPPRTMNSGLAAHGHRGEAGHPGFACPCAVTFRKRDAGRAGGESRRRAVGVSLALSAELFGQTNEIATDVAAGLRAEAKARRIIVAAKRGNFALRRRSDPRPPLLTRPDPVGAAPLPRADARAALAGVVARHANIQAAVLVRRRLLWLFILLAFLPGICALWKTRNAQPEPAPTRARSTSLREGA